MRISAWSSDVCSSDLLSDRDPGPAGGGPLRALPGGRARQWRLARLLPARWEDLAAALRLSDRRRGVRCGLCPRHCARPELLGRSRQGAAALGRASCRERVCQYVSISVVAVYFKKQTEYKANNN